MVRRAAVLVFMLGLCSPGAALGAPPAKDSAGTERPKPDTNKLQAELDSADPTRMLAALDQIAAAPEHARELAPLVEGLLRRGATIAVSTRAIEVAGTLAQPSSSAAVAPYLRHREAALRRAAVHALVRTGGSDAVKALRHALRSSDASLRGPAATGLGTLAAREAVPDLLRALDHHVNEAAEAIGQLCSPEQCRDYSQRLGRLPFDVMMAGIQALLFRPSEQVPDGDKVAVIGAVAELGTSEARRFLRGVLQRWPESGSSIVRDALTRAVRGEKVP